MSTEAVQASDIPDLVHDALISEHGESQEKRVKGYIRTQSIKELFKYLDPEDIIRLKGERQLKDKTESFGALLPPSVNEYLSQEELIKRRYFLNFDRLEHGVFNWPEVRTIIEDQDLKDIAVTHLVYRFEDQELHDRLLSLLDDVMDYSETGTTHFRQPFHAELKSRSPGASTARKEVRNYNDESLFSSLHWKIRTLDLEGIWSLDAWTGEGKDIMGKGYGQREVEELAFNSASNDAPKYGAVNSTIIYNQWKKTLSPGLVDYKEWEWSGEQNWEQVR